MTKRYIHGISKEKPEPTPGPPKPNPVLMEMIPSIEELMRETGRVAAPITNLPYQWFSGSQIFPITNTPIINTTITTTDNSGQVNVIGTTSNAYDPATLFEVGTPEFFTATVLSP